MPVRRRPPRRHPAADRCLSPEEKLAAKRRAEQAQVEDEPPEKDEAGAEQQADAQIGLGQRAQPLIRLMEWTAKEEGFILWQADQDF